MPSRVQVGPYLYRVVTDADSVRRHERSVGGEYLHGGHDYEQGEIAVDGNAAPAVQAVTLTHELLHALSGLVDSRLSAAAEERLIESLAPALVDVLRRNPALVRFLTGKENE